MKYIVVDVDIVDVDAGRYDFNVNREREIMSKKVVKPIVLTVIFICALVTFGVTTNKMNIDLTANMEDATLPVMYFVHNDAVINELHGYVQEMDLLSMRDNILPIGEDRILQLNIRTYGEEIEKLSYFICSFRNSHL